MLESDHESRGSFAIHLDIAVTFVALSWEQKVYHKQQVVIVFIVIVLALTSVTPRISNGGERRKAY